MPTTRFPRSGSMQFWPRKRAKRPYARVRSWVQPKETKPCGFPGYKAGMTHIMITDNRKTSLTKGEDIRFPVTVLECPPLSIMGIVFYKKSIHGLSAVSCVLAEKFDRHLHRKLLLPKKAKQHAIPEASAFDDIRLLVHTSPALTGIGKKKPEVFEVGLGGSKEEKLAYAKDRLGRQITVRDVLREGQQVDIHGVTRGKGYQGPVKRFGIHIRHHKSEKTKRGPGTLGAWSGHGHIMYRVPHAGKMGFHLRTHLNQQLIRISENTADINPSGGFVNFGLVKNTYVLVKGSVQGDVNTTVLMTHAERPSSRIPSEAPAVQYVSLASKQG